MGIGAERRASNDTLCRFALFASHPEQLKETAEARRRMTAKAERFQGTEGRWWLVESCLGGHISASEQALARCRVLLDRYGVLCREPGAEQIKEIQ